MHRSALLVSALILACLVASFASHSPTVYGEDREGALWPAAVAGPPIDPLDASLSLTLFSNVSVVDPGDLAWLIGEATNSGTEDATNVTLEAPLDPDTSHVQSIPAAVYDSANRTLRWTFGTVAAGANVNVFWQIQVAVGTPDNTSTTSRLRASYANATGVEKPPEEVTTQIRVRAPVFSPSLVPTVAAAERGETVVVKLHINNTGSATAPRAWANWTLGGHFRFLFLEEAVTSVTNVTDGFNVTLSNLAPGSHALTAHLEVLRSLEDGRQMGIQVLWRAKDGNGNLLANFTTGNSVVLLAPKFTLDLNSSATVNTNSRFVLTATLRNSGRAAGIGWLNMTLPGGVSFISDNASFRRTNQGKRYTWTIPSVSPGSAVVLGITFESGTNAEAATFAFALQFTDLRGSPPVAGPAPRIDVQFVVPGTGSPDGFPWWALAVAAGGLAAVALVWRRRRVSDLQVEDVFVADMGGHLLAHRSSGLVAYEDEDILVGMFKVIQDFVKDSFAKGTDDVMRSMEFGERKIIIERGRFHFISVVYRGLDRGSLAERVRKVSRLIDHRYGQALENWSGDLDELRGLASLLPQVWKHQPRSRAPLQPGSVAPPGTGGPSGGEASAAKKGGGSAESGDPEAVVGRQK